MDSRLAVLIVFLAVAATAQAQARRDGGGVRPATPAADETRALRVPAHRAQRDERCTNFSAELRDARRAEREATTTTASDQASLRRQRLLEQSQKAGC